MELSFRKFMEYNVPGTHNDGPGSSFNFGTGGAFVTSDQSGSETQSNRTPYFPAYELTAQVVPHTTIHGKILQKKEYQAPYKTLVQLRISDNASKRDETIALNTDQYRTMQKMNGGRKPKEGDEATVALLRLPTDRTSQATVMGIRY